MTKSDSFWATGTAAGFLTAPTPFGFLAFGGGVNEIDVGAHAEGTTCGVQGISVSQQLFDIPTFFSFSVPPDLIRPLPFPDRTGVFGWGDRFGVVGQGGAPGAGLVTSAGVAVNAAGVAGTAREAVGVFGASVSATGVLGSSETGLGVRGESINKFGVFGQAGLGAAPFVGLSARSLVRTAGVAGTAREAIGVFGTSVATFGVFGTSSNSFGVVGKAGLSASFALPPINPANPVTAAGVVGTSRREIGVFGTSTESYGVAGVSINKFGVFGSSPSFGVVGMASSGAGLILTEVTSGLPFTGAGVIGTSPQLFGVCGISVQSAGVFGESTDGIGISGFSRNNTGIFGISNRGYGVRGESLGDDGVRGITLSGPTSAAPENQRAGVRGQADLTSGVIGVSAAAAIAGTAAEDVPAGVKGFSLAGSFGVYGIGPTVGGAGIAGLGRGMSLAGYFIGDVQVVGNVTITGNITAANKGVVPFPDGSRRLLHCMESPDYWFEDFGRGRLRRGRAVVKIDRDFARTIRTAGYHVFVTPEGTCEGLCVRNRTATSFEVRELRGGTGHVAFSYRIIGKRKDMRAPRFPKVEVVDPVRYVKKPSRARKAAADRALRRLLKEVRAVPRGAKRRAAKRR